MQSAGRMKNLPAIDLVRVLSDAAQDLPARTQRGLDQKSHTAAMSF
jgi:hypothetical protein